MRTLSKLLLFLFLVSAGAGNLMGCAPVQTGPQLANGCREGSHMEQGQCVQDRRTEDCSQLLDLDGDGLVPSLDCEDCPGLCFNAADGGMVHMDGGFSADAGTPSYECTEYCYLTAPVVRHALPDGGSRYTFTNGEPIPQGNGITNREVGLDAPYALKVCYPLLHDTDHDGVPNQADNCWMMPNIPPTCSANSGCVNAGNLCVDGVCVEQLDSDHDGVGDACDPTPGESDWEWARFCDPDADNDAIVFWEDNCPYLGTTHEDNNRDDDKDGIPNACDPCAFQDQACQGS